MDNADLKAPFQTNWIGLSWHGVWPSALAEIHPDTLVFTGIRNTVVTRELSRKRSANSNIEGASWEFRGHKKVHLYGD